MLAFIAAAIYAYVATLQKNTMNQTLLAIRQQNVGLLRALIIRNGQPAVRIGETLKISYANTGHSPAKVQWAAGIYKQNIVGERPVIINSPEVPFGERGTIAPGDLYVLLVRLPKIPINIESKGYVTVEIRIGYDDGFGDSETTYSCFSLNAATGTWNETCGLAQSIDLSRDSTSDITPDQNHK